MAQIEADREDLFEEFRSAKVKWELQIPGFNSNLVLGTRRDDRLSIYFGPDPCYHYDAKNRLLRAFTNGFLYRTQGNTLARLTRERTPESTTLLRYDLSTEELNGFMREMTENLTLLLHALTEETQTLLRSDAEVQQLSEIQIRLAEILSSDSLLAPAYPTRKT